VIADIGANIGYYTAIAAEATGPEGLVLAFEPEPENFKFLKKTVVLNGFKNVECCEMGIADFEGRGKLYLSTEGNMGDHRIYLSPEKRPGIDIELTTLDNFLKKRGIAKLDVIKMDIQGAEGLAIRGMKETLKNSEKLKIFTEFWPTGIERTGLKPADFLYALARANFKIYNINRKNGALESISDFESFAKKFGGREFANLYCEK